MSINISVTPAEQEMLLDGLRAHIGQIAKWQGEARAKGDQAGFDSFGERYTGVAALLRAIEAIEPEPMVVEAVAITDATDAAIEKFWAEIVRHYPTATGGDLEPEAIHEFESVANAAVKRWVHWNVEGN